MTDETARSEVSHEAHVAVARRLMANCEDDRGDWADAPMKVPASTYRDPHRWQREMDRVFHRSPLVVALSADVAEPGDYVTEDIAGRPVVVVRGDDGRVRTFVNACRHRGAPVAEGCGHARRLTCPYHAWVYDTSGALVGVPGRVAFGDLDVAGLVELPTEERVGVVVSVLTPDADLDVNAWLDGMGDALALLRLDEVHRYATVSEIDGPNWKLAADGYVDGYHIGYLHKRSIGVNAITNRNTYDLFGAHQRIGFATRETPGLAEVPEERWRVFDALSMVWFLFPNVSIAGKPDGALMVSRLLPGPTPERSRTRQTHYFREPVVTDEARARAEERRNVYAAVVRDEDYATGLKIGGALDAIGDGHFRFGRNEVGNQHLHRTIDALVEA